MEETLLHHLGKTGNYNKAFTHLSKYETPKEVLVIDNFLVLPLLIMMWILDFTISIFIKINKVLRYQLI